MNALPLFAAGTAPGGITPPSMPGGRAGFLSDVIAELGFTDAATIDQAVRTARSPGTTVARVLVEMGAITEDQLAHATAERHGLAYVDLAVFPVDPVAANRLAPETARRYRCVGLAFADDHLLVTMADPADALGVADVAAITGLRVVAAVSPASAIEELIGTLPLPEPAGALRPVPAAAPSLVADSVPPTPTAAPAPSELDGGELIALRTEVEARQAELSVLRERVATLESDAVRAHAEVDTRQAELMAARARGETAEAAADDARRRAAEAQAEAESARARTVKAEREAQEANVRAEELRGADRRAEQARLALADLREETDREREQQALVVRDLRAKADEEERRRRMLEERLGEVESGVFAAERAFEELRQAQRRMRGSLRALTDPAPADAAAG